MMHPYRFSPADAENARTHIDPVFLNTPQYINDGLSQALGSTVVTKVETLNPIRCFKGRGADLLVRRAAPGAPLVCASAGNFGQAMAYCCQKRQLPLTVFASTQANSFKVERMMALGATVVRAGHDFDDAKSLARQYANDNELRFVEDSLDLETLVGAATIGLELLAFQPMPDVVLIPVGNGALFNGIARVMKAVHHSIQMVAIQAKGAPAMIDSWRQNVAVSYDTVNTIADGIAVRVPVPQALQDMKGLVDRALLVEEESILEGMRLIHQHGGIVVEPSGAVGVAALLENRELFRGQTVVTILCGGNLTSEQQRTWLC